MKCNEFFQDVQRVSGDKEYICFLLVVFLFLHFSCRFRTVD